MTGRLALVAVAVVALAFLWVKSCSGPDPRVTDVRLIEPRAESTPYRVEATIRNQGQGGGDAQVLFRLRNGSTGVIVQEEKRISLEKDETILSVVEIPAPRAAYTPIVEANYPPR
jgi:hypothetical protein